jgi:hypothetical protein
VLCAWITWRKRIVEWGAIEAEALLLTSSESEQGREGGKECGMRTHIRHDVVDDGKKVTEVEND